MPPSNIAPGAGTAAASFGGSRSLRLGNQFEALKLQPEPLHIASVDSKSVSPPKATNVNVKGLLLTPAKYTFQVMLVRPGPEADAKIGVLA